MVVAAAQAGRLAKAVDCNVAGGKLVLGLVLVSVCGAGDSAVAVLDVVLVDGVEAEVVELFGCDAVGGFVAGLEGHGGAAEVAEVLLLVVRDVVGGGVIGESDEGAGAVVEAGGCAGAVGGGATYGALFTRGRLSVWVREDEGVDDEPALLVSVVAAIAVLVVDGLGF